VLLPNAFTETFLGPLQFSTYTDDVPDEVKYGELAMVIAHELFHALDYNSVDGNIDQAKYKARMECLINAYNNETYFQQPVDGVNTLTENICDHGALRVAWNAL